MQHAYDMLVACNVQLMTELNLSRSDLGTVHEYVRSFLTPEQLETTNFVSGRTARSKVAEATSRHRDGTLVRSTFHVPAGIPGVEEQDVVFQFQDPISAVVELLLDNSIASHENWIWDPVPQTGTYSELNTGAFWNIAVKRSKAAELGFKLCPIGLYADAANPDFRSGVGLKPIVLTCGNYIGAVNRTSKGKRCIGYWPKLPVSTLHVACNVYACCMQCIRILHAMYTQ
jgi:hypothetical protein